MAIDLPAQWVEQAQRIDWDSVCAAVADYGSHSTARYVGS